VLIAFAVSLGLGFASAASAGPRRRAPVKAHAHATAKPGVKPAPAIRTLTLAPAAASLNGPRAVQHFIVTATLANGDTIDVTDRATFRSLSPAIAHIAAPGVVASAGDGTTTIVARVPSASGAREAFATVTARGAAAPATVSFVNDVMPVLSKAGCNASACHGSPVGKAGFKLSLFGYEPELDQQAIKDAAGRRVNEKS